MQEYHKDPSTIGGRQYTLYAQWKFREFNELWHGLEVPNDVDLLKALASDGLQATAAASVVPKGGGAKKKGKKSAPKQRQIRLTNTHLKGTIDLSRDYVAPGSTSK